MNERPPVLSPVLVFELRREAPAIQTGDARTSLREIVEPSASVAWRMNATLSTWTSSGSKYTTSESSGT